MGKDSGYDAEHLTPRQKAWFATIRANMEAETGKSMDEWVAIARTCPETGMRARVTWMKTHHRLGSNRAATVMSEAFPSQMGWENPDDLRAALWKDAQGLALLEAVEERVADFEGLITGQRKGFSAWSREFQFAALRPMKGGKARLGLAIPPDADPRLEAPKNEGWSDRLKSTVVLSSPEEVDDRLADLLKTAFDRS